MHGGGLSIAMQYTHTTAATEQSTATATEKKNHDDDDNSNNAKQNRMGNETTKQNKTHRATAIQIVKLRILDKGQPQMSLT